MAAHQVAADIGTFDGGIVHVIFKVYRGGELLGGRKSLKAPWNGRKHM